MPFFAPAEKCGIALQWTNILRDVKEDLARNRVYLPQTDLRKHQVTEADLRGGTADAHFHSLMADMIDRTKTYYREGQPVLQSLEPAGRRMCGVILDRYRALLDAIERRPEVVLQRRIHLPVGTKARLTLRWFFRGRTAMPRGCATSRARDNGENVTLDSIARRLADGCCFRCRSRKPSSYFRSIWPFTFSSCQTFKKGSDELTDSLDRWLYFLNNGEGLSPDNLPESIRIPEVEEAMSVLKALTEEEREWHRYFDREKARRDALNWQLSLERAQTEVERAQAEAEQAQAEVEQAQAEVERVQAKAERVEAEAEAKAERIMVEGLVGQVRLCEELLNLPPIPDEQLHAMRAGRSPATGRPAPAIARLIAFQSLQKPLWQSWQALCFRGAFQTARLQPDVLA